MIAPNPHLATLVLSYSTDFEVGTTLVFPYSVLSLYRGKVGRYSVPTLVSLNYYCIRFINLALNWQMIS